MALNNSSDGADKSNDANHDSNIAEMNASLEADLAELNELLSKETLDDAGEASVEELLARLESADGVAKGVENKLDALLGNLDSLLAALEKNNDVQSEESETARTAPASEPSTTEDKER